MLRFPEPYAVASCVRLPIPLFLEIGAHGTRIHHFNASGRGLTDGIAVLDTRGPGRLASRLKWLSMPHFSGINGDGTLNLHGLSIRADPHTDVLHILLNNHRPPLDPRTGAPLDAAQVGANSTLEHFETRVGSAQMRHVRTYTDPLIATPNRVAWLSEDAFVFTNSHSGKVGFVSAATRPARRPRAR